MAAARITRERKLIEDMKAQGKAAAVQDSLKEATSPEHTSSTAHVSRPVPAAAPKRVPEKIPVDRGSGSKRWDRQAYNAYMKVYMQKYRAKIKARNP